MTKHSPDDAAWQRLRTHFADALPPHRYAGVGIVIAVSGGADSVALARLAADHFSDLGERRMLTIAHFNHGLRGAESDADERFVEALAEKLGIAVAIGTAAQAADLNAGEAGGAAHVSPCRDEASLRATRYEFLHRVLARRGGRVLLTAHTADDRVETMLHQLLRGTGPGGLCGMPSSRPLGDDFMIVRPLLSVRRRQLRAALPRIGQAWREDASNDDPRYTRNWIRSQLLPLIRQRYPGADDAILRLLRCQAQWHRSMTMLADTWREQHVRQLDDVIRIDRQPVDPAVLGLVIASIWDQMGWSRRDLNARHHQQLAELVGGGASRGRGAAPKAIMLPGPLRAAVDHVYDQIVICHWPRRRRK